MKRIIIGAAATIGLLAFPLAGGVASASVHPASSYGCRNYDPYCGSQELQDGSQFVWAVQGGVAKSGTPIVVQRHSLSRSDQDFDMRNVNNGLSNTGGPDKRFQFAPNGDVSGLCISDPNNKSYTKLILRPCNNSAFQSFQPIYSSTDPVTFASIVGWESLQSNENAIQDPSYGFEGTQLNVAPYNGDDNQLWEYVL